VGGTYRFDFILRPATDGRPGTPMPAFGVGAGGQYSDNQMRQIASYILSVQTGEVGEVDAQAFVGASGEDLFADHCARCHGADGQGVVGPTLLNLYERYGFQEGDDPGDVRAVIRQAVLQGRDLPGNAPMPSFAQVLSDDAITAIIEHIESFQETGGPRFAQIGGEPSPEGDDQ
jgi:cytochrome c oxidase cbb3-type subunit III